MLLLPDERVRRLVDVLAILNPITVVVKPTLYCNTDCRHCYHPLSERSDLIMSSETLEKVIRYASEYETVWFVWHGGEPLTLPLSFYKEVVKLQKKYFGADSHRISNTIQTNGILIDKKFMNFCKENKINVGVSFEGRCNDILRSRTDIIGKNLEMMRKEG